MERMSATETVLMERAISWVAANHCPLPVDLASELYAIGLDAEVIERELLSLHSEEEDA